MQPSLDEIQHALNRCTQYVLEVSRGIAQWGQNRSRKESAKEAIKPGAADGTEDGKQHVSLVFWFLLKVVYGRTLY